LMRRARVARTARAVCGTHTSRSLQIQLPNSEGSLSGMDKKEIDSPKLTVNFIIWICGVGGAAAPDFLGSFRLENYMNPEKFQPRRDNTST
jgi:hypothetical protein